MKESIFIPVLFKGESILIHVLFKKIDSHSYVIKERIDSHSCVNQDSHILKINFIAIENLFSY